MRSRIVLGLVLAAGGIVSGCTSYYEVSDPGTNRVYYTEKLDRRDSGTVRFKDARSGEEITLPASADQRDPKRAVRGRQGRAADYRTCATGHLALAVRRDSCRHHAEIQPESGAPAQRGPHAGCASTVHLITAAHSRLSAAGKTPASRIKL
jgi:hypothetical protein